MRALIIRAIALLLSFALALLSSMLICVLLYDYIINPPLDFVSRWPAAMRVMAVSTVTVLSVVFGAIICLLVFYGIDKFRARN